MWTVLFFSVIFNFVLGYGAVSPDHNLTIEYLFERNNVGHPLVLGADEKVILDDGVETTLLCSMKNINKSEIKLRWEVDEYELDINSTNANIAMVFTPDDDYNHEIIVSCVASDSLQTEILRRNITLVRNTISENKSIAPYETREGEEIKAPENKHCILEYQNSTKTKFIPSNNLIDKNTMNFIKLNKFCANLNYNGKLRKLIPRIFDIYKLNITKYLLVVEKPKSYHDDDDDQNASIKPSFPTQIVIAGVVGLLIMLIILIIMFKYIRRWKQNRIENTYEEPKYAEIQLNNHGCVPEREDESPYAKIIGVIIRNRKPVLPPRNSPVTINTDVTFDTNLQVNTYATRNIQVKADVQSTNIYTVVQ